MTNGLNDKENTSDNDDDDIPNFSQCTTPDNDFDIQKYVDYDITTPPSSWKPKFELGDVVVSTLKYEHYHFCAVILGFIEPKGYILSYFDECPSYGYFKETNLQLFGDRSVRELEWQLESRIEWYPDCVNWDIRDFKLSVQIARTYAETFNKKERNQRRLKIHKDLKISDLF